jgi:predicted esterase
MQNFHEIEFSFKARYYKSAEITSDTKAIWFVLHGYGQLAQFFIRKFSALSDNHVCVIAPEGLSRFYLQNINENGGRNSDRVGATWMTKENRLMDIENYLTYLTSIYKKEIGDRNIPVTILGFSQGSATASRWALSGNVKFDQLILWAGIFPPDMDFENGKEILKGKKVYHVYGAADPFLSDSRFQEMKILSAKLGATIHEMTFTGGHDIDSPALLKLI